MKLSIIVPVYNMLADGKLEYCLQSLLAQTFEDYEIIAVDDKSTDDSLTLLQQYEQRFPEKIKVIASPENRRQGGAKNLGLDSASGEWIGFVDSDDWIAADMYPALLQKAEETGADVVGCDYLVTDEIGKETGTREINNTTDQTGILDEERKRKLLIKPGSMVIKIYKRSLFEKNHIRFPEKIFYEDNAIGVLPLLYAERFERVERCLYFYYQHQSSTVHTVDLGRLHNRVEAAMIYLRECKERGFYEKYKEEIDYKVFELGYRNTVFSYLQTEKKVSFGFLAQMKHFLREYVPDFAANSYYEKYMDAENKKLIRIHMRSTLLFLVYYKLLQTYRAVRYRK